RDRSRAARGTHSRARPVPARRGRERVHRIRQRALRHQRARRPLARAEPARHEHRSRYAPRDGRRAGSPAVTRYVLRRALEMTGALLAMSLIVFVLSRALGDPATLMLSDYATEADREAMRAELGLDRSWPAQIGRAHV